MPIQPIIATDVVRRYGARTIINGRSLTVSPGARVGLVGENGSGKSTLIRVIAGIDQPDEGTVTRPADLGYLSQRPDFPPRTTVGEAITTALADLHDAVARMEILAERLDDPACADAYAATLEWVERHNAWDADRRANVAMAQLELNVQQDRLVETLSGGERVRLALACLMVRQPDCVIMDEPTNHLDAGAMELLESFLRELPGPVLVASHDRIFLDQVCTHVIDTDPNPVGIDGVGGSTFTGAFSDYLEKKRAARARWEQTYSAQQDELKRLRHEIKMGARAVGHVGSATPRDADKHLAHQHQQHKEAAISRRVRSAALKLQEAENNQIRKPRAGLRFQAPNLATDQRGLEVCARDLILRGNIVVARFDVSAGEHWLIAGENGCGKSSLLRAIAGEPIPQSGNLSKPRGSVGYLAQDVVFPHPDRSARRTFAQAAGEDVSLTELGLIHGADMNKSVGALSVGQQRRLALAIIIARQPEVLLLDEPTNHISLSLATELEEALAASTATVIVASHDRWLRRHWAGEIYDMS